MNAPIDLTQGSGRPPTSGSGSDPVVEGRLWCPATLPNGTHGHWYFAAESAPLVCHDPDCPSHGQVMYQCPLHRGFIGQIDASHTRMDGSAIAVAEVLPEPVGRSGR